MVSSALVSEWPRDCGMSLPVVGICGSRHWMSAEMQKHHGGPVSFPGGGAQGRRRHGPGCGLPEQQGFQAGSRAGRRLRSACGWLPQDCGAGQPGGTGQQRAASHWVVTVLPAEVTAHDRPGRTTRAFLGIGMSARILLQLAEFFLAGSVIHRRFVFPQAMSVVWLAL